MKIPAFFKFMFRPSYWTVSYSYSQEWDEHLNAMMDKHRFVPVDKFTAEIGGVEVWIENHPYASFTRYPEVGTRVRPSRTTIAKAMKRLQRDLAEHEARKAIAAEEVAMLNRMYNASPSVKP